MDDTTLNDTYEDTVNMVRRKQREQVGLEDRIEKLAYICYHTDMIKRPKNILWYSFCPDCGVILIKRDIGYYKWFKCPMCEYEYANSLMFHW